MKTTKIKIRNLFGITEQELDGRSIEITGTNGVGKTSVIDAIKYALQNSSDREYILKNGENEGEIIIETDTGIYIDRKKRVGQTDYKSVKENGQAVQSPENFLRQLFTPLQLDPVAFIQTDKKEQNRIILDLVEFNWDLNWIKEQFGEIPTGVNYEQNILQVLNDIQSENGDYFRRRQDINRDMRNKRAFIEDIAKDIPENYDADTWRMFDFSEKYRELESIRHENNVIQRARAFKDAYDNKVRGLQAEREMQLAELERSIADEKTALTADIERMRAEIKAAEEKISGLEEKDADKRAVIEERYSAGIEKLGNDVATAEKYTSKEIEDTAGLEDEISEAEEMVKHLREFDRMCVMQNELEQLTKQSDDLTSKIELARNLPAEILKSASIPIDGLTVENGIPLIHGLPVSNLSEGEKLSLCVDIALSKPNSLQIILIDGSERLSDDNRKKLYEKCKEKGLQFIATRTTNNEELEVVYL